METDTDMAIYLLIIVINKPVNLPTVAFCLLKDYFGNKDSVQDET